PPGVLMRPVFEIVVHSHCFRCMLRPARVEQCLTPNCNQVCMPRLQQIVGKFGGTDETHSLGLDTDLITDSLRKLRLIPGSPLKVRICGACNQVSAGRAVDHVHAYLLQLSRENDAVFNLPSTVDPVHCGDPNE